MRDSSTRPRSPFTEPCKTDSELSLSGITCQNNPLIPPSMSPSIGPRVLHDYQLVGTCMPLTTSFGRASEGARRKHGATPASRLAEPKLGRNMHSLPCRPGASVSSRRISQLAFIDSPIFGTFPLCAPCKPADIARLRFPSTPFWTHHATSCKCNVQISRQAEKVGKKERNEP